MAAIADDIAYDAHDIDDGLRAGLFRVDDLKVMPLAAEMIADIAKRYPGLDDIRRGAELVRELISYLIGAVVSESRRRLEVAQPKSVDDVRHQAAALIAFSAGGGAGGSRHQGLPQAADVPAFAGDAGDGRCRTDPV